MISASAFTASGRNFDVGHGDVVIAAITSCTNTSNPYVLVAAGLVARKARSLGLHPKPWVKTSLAPGSQVVTEYLDKSGLSADLDALGFNTAGYGCTTCIGNSGPLDEAIVDAIENNKLIAVSVLSGNRNFEGRVHANVRANYLASPPLVVAYALLGNIREDITSEPLGTGSDGKPVYLRDVWPTNREIDEIVAASVNACAVPGPLQRGDAGDEGVAGAAGGNRERNLSLERWQHVCEESALFRGHHDGAGGARRYRGGTRVGAAGRQYHHRSHQPGREYQEGFAGGCEYLGEHQVLQKDFNSYGSRRGNHEVMMRGTFANIRIRNEMVAGVEGGMTRHYPGGQTMPIYDAAMLYKKEGVKLVVFGGKEYGMGSSRDWAAKGTMLLGITAVIAESFERIHRSNLVGMGVLPLLFPEGVTRATLGLVGDETIDILGLEDLHPRMDLVLKIHRGGRHDRRAAGDLPCGYAGRGELLPAWRDIAVRAARDGEGGLSRGLSPSGAAAPCFGMAP